MMLIAKFKGELDKGKENSIFTDGGPLESYLGVNDVQHKDETFELNQIFLIEQIIKTIIGDENILHKTNIPAIKE
jgi:hypothetical protein